MRIVAAVLALAACTTDYQVHEDYDTAVELEIEADGGLRVGSCVAEPADGLLFCAVPRDEAAAALSCESMGAMLAPAPEDLDDQRDMAYGALLHFGDVPGWWIASETFGEDVCTAQFEHGNWSPVDCSTLKPYICALTSSDGSL